MTWLHHIFSVFFIVQIGANRYRLWPQMPITIIIELLTADWSNMKHSSKLAWEPYQQTGYRLSIIYWKDS